MSIKVWYSSTLFLQLFSRFPLGGEYIYDNFFQGIAAFGAILGNIRINKLMEHYDKVQDPMLRNLTYTTYKRLHTCVQNILEKRNARRKAELKLTFQYLEPKWLANSVHV